MSFSFVLEIVRWGKLVSSRLYTGSTTCFGVGCFTAGAARRDSHSRQNLTPASRPVNNKISGAAIHKWGNRLFMGSRIQVGCRFGGLGLEFTLIRRARKAVGNQRFCLPDLLRKIFNPMHFPSPARLLTRFHELKDLNQRLKQIEVYTDQLYSLLQLNGLALAVPPAHLQIRVSGDYYNNFFRHGQFLLNQLNAGLTAVGERRTLAEFDIVLDFGCGRTLIPLALRSRNPAGVHGVDIDAEAINWLAEHYPQLGSVGVNPAWPIMRHEAAKFDLLYAISVFTHLPEAMEHAWLDDISRVLKTGGYALLTIHGKAFFDLLARPAAQQVQQAGFVYVAGDAVTAGLPDFYKNSYHTAEYIRGRWSPYGEVVQIIPQGVDQQDLVVLRKR